MVPRGWSILVAAAFVIAFAPAHAGEAMPRPTILAISLSDRDGEQSCTAGDDCSAPGHEMSFFDHLRVTGFAVPAANAYAAGEDPKPTPCGS